MPKWLPISKFLQLRISTCIIFVLCLIGLIQFFASYGHYNYTHLPREHLVSNVYFHTNSNLDRKKERPNCNYDGILQSTSSSNSWEVPKKYDDFSANGLANGTYSPENCNALISVAVLVTYRNRQSQLDVFIPYMHNFLRKQGIHYRQVLIYFSCILVIVKNYIMILKHSFIIDNLANTKKNTKLYKLRDIFYWFQYLCHRATR